LSDRLAQAGFGGGARSFFLLEGLLMYLQPASVDETFGVMKEFAGAGSEVVFDYVRAPVLRREGQYYGEREILETVASAGEQWHFGIEEGNLVGFLEPYGLRVVDHKNPQELERMYFTDTSGRMVGRVNGTHCLVRAAW
jgi:methyltransferase (TIGR00027 family)